MTPLKVTVMVKASSDGLGAVGDRTDAVIRTTLFYFNIKNRITQTFFKIFSFNFYKRVIGSISVMMIGILFAFKEHGDGLADHISDVLLFEERAESLETVGAHCLYTVGELRKLGGRSPVARRVLENVNFREADPFRKGERFLKVVLGLSRESDHHIGSDRAVGEVRAYRGDEPEVLVAGVVAIHAA